MMLRNPYPECICVEPAAHRSSSGKLVVLSFLIGCMGGFSQCLRGQDSAVDILSISPRDDVLPGRFESLFRSDHENDWLEGWRLARSLGVTAAPMLEALWRNETPNPGDRLLLITAVGLAAGGSGGEFLFGILDDRDRPLRERVMSHLSLALGDERPGSGMTLDRILGFTSHTQAEPVFAVSACMALRRFRDSGQAPRVFYQSQDPGIAAAAQFSHPTTVPLRWLRRTRKHRNLVLRGFLLGRSSSANREAQHVRALEILDAADPSTSMHLCAALNLARTGVDSELATIFMRPSLKEFLPALVETHSMRRRVIRSGLISAQPERRLGRNDRARLALAYALDVDLKRLGEETAAWGRENRMAAAICLGLAWRLAKQPEPWPSRYVEALPNLPEAEWVRLALGLDVRDRRSAFLDPALQRAFSLAIEGRLPRDATAIAIENSLWRRGWHLGLTRREAEHALIADLVFAGSEYGASKMLLGPNARAYLPKGIPVRDAFFRIAYQFFAFVSEPGPRVQAGYELH